MIRRGRPPIKRAGHDIRSISRTPAGGRPLSRPRHWYSGMQKGRSNWTGLRTTWDSNAYRIRIPLPMAAPRATRPAAAASATTGETWIDFFHHGSSTCGTSAGRASMICAVT